MSYGDVLNNDYVASLLIKDAEASRKQRGSSLLSRPGRRADAPKPNTTFLRNIIRETDSHNTALKEREARESRARLHDLRGKVSDAGRKRARADEEHESNGDAAKRPRHETHRQRKGRWRAAFNGLMEQDSARGQSEQQHSRTAREDLDKEATRSQKSHTYKGRSGKDCDKRSRRHHARSRSQSQSGEERSLRTHRSKDPDSYRTGRVASPSRRRERVARSRSTSRTESASDDEVGPEPPPTVMPRGRGAFKRSGMEARFHPDYNPKLDVEPEITDLQANDDWDMALEAVKDRVKWRAQGGDRLRAAGFTEEEVRRWEKGDEKDATDVRWRMRGEDREWDRGKVPQEDI